MVERLVNCIKFSQKLPGLKTLPMPGELGKRIYENVSQKAWDEFIEYFKMVINEYRLDLTNTVSDQIFEQKAQEYFFGDNYTMPEGYMPKEKDK